MIDLPCIYAVEPGTHAIDDVHHALGIGAEAAAGYRVVDLVEPIAKLDFNWLSRIFREYQSCQKDVENVTIDIRAYTSCQTQQNIFNILNRYGDFVSSIEYLQASLEIARSYQAFGPPCANG